MAAADHLLAAVIANLFHDLPASKASPGSFVLVRSLNAWLARIAARVVHVNGATVASEKEGAHFTLPIVEPAYEIAPSWTVERGPSGFVVGYGLISISGAGASRVPQIGGVAIDEDPSLPVDERPWLAVRDDGVIAIEVKARLTHGTIPANASGSGAEPPYSATASWNDWPVVKWMSDIALSTPAAHPPAGTFTDIVRAVPLARVRDGRIFRLRWTNVALVNLRITTLHRYTIN